MAPPNQDSNPAGQKKSLARVLVVEDHPDIGLAMRLMLARYDIAASQATGGRQALERLETESFDLILLDNNMPDMNGIELCRLLKADKRLKQIPVIFVTSRFDDAFRDEVRRLGAVDHIHKPFTLVPFVTCVSRHLGLETTVVEDARRAGLIQPVIAAVGALLS